MYALPGATTCLSQLIVTEPIGAVADDTWRQQDLPTRVLPNAPKQLRSAAFPYRRQKCRPIAQFATSRISDGHSSTRECVYQTLTQCEADMRPLGGDCDPRD